jgi:hypothetical protein
MITTSPNPRQTVTSLWARQTVHEVGATVILNDRDNTWLFRSIDWVLLFQSPHVLLD